MQHSNERQHGDERQHVISNLDFFHLVEQELEENGQVRFRVKGTSMQPMLRNGLDEVLLKIRGNRTPMIGDICLFKFHGQHILHRCIRREGPVFYMQGDNIINMEEHCAIDDILGIVEKIYRDDRVFLPDDPLWKSRIRHHRCRQRSRLHLMHIKAKILSVLQKLKLHR